MYWLDARYCARYLPRLVSVIITKYFLHMWETLRLLELKQVAQDHMDFDGGARLQTQNRPTV